MPSENAAPTLDDVAKAAKVSTATVSRCLNLPDRVAKPTLTRVMQAVEALGYTPNFGARVMAAKRTYTIGAIIPTMENAIFARGLQAFQEELQARGYTLLVSSSGYKPDVEKDQIRALVARGADALLLIGYDRDPQIYDFLAQRNIPALVTWTYEKDHRIPSIGFDNRASMCRLVDQVITLGHRDIAMISGITEGNDRAAERLQGVGDALHKAGLDRAALQVIETPYDIQNGAAAMKTIMTSPCPPTAVICGNDVLAAGALRCAQQMGLRVPQDVSITGFDDIELARIVSPDLTTVHVPHHEMGRRAAQELVAIVDKQSTGVSVELTASLVMRGSLAAPASGS